MEDELLITETVEGDMVVLTLRMPTSAPYARVAAIKRAIVDAGRSSPVLTGGLQGAILPTPAVPSPALHIPNEVPRATRDWAAYIGTCDCGQRPTGGLKGIGQHARGACIHAPGLILAANGGSSIYRRVIEAIEQFSGGKEFTSTDMVRAFRSHGCGDDLMAEATIRNHVYWLAEAGRAERIQGTHPHKFRWRAEKDPKKK